MSAIPVSHRTDGGWRVALPALLMLLAAIGLIYRETAAAMVAIWSRSETFAHAYMVLPISLWLIWRQRKHLAELSPRPQPWVLVPMLLVGVTWMLADLVVVNAASQFAFVALLVLTVPAVLGLQVANVILFPLLFLFFAVPAGEFLLPVLMEYTANFTVAALRLSGIPVYREGLQFVIPSGNWSVVEACSGVRYLIASFMVGTLFAYLNYKSAWRRAVFMGVSILVPIVANWVRAYLIVMLGHLSGNTVAVGVDHLIYGWLFFGVVVTIMFLAGARWSEPGAVSSGTPIRLSSGRSSPSSWAFGGVLVASVLAVSLPPLAVATIESNQGSAAAPTLELPVRLGDWQAADAGAELQWRPRFVNPSGEVARTYVLDGQAVGVYIAYYRGQGPERKLVSSRNVLVASDDRNWSLVSTGRRTIEMEGLPLNLRTAILLGPPESGVGDRRRLVVWRSYWVNARMVSSEAAAKWHAAVGMLREQRDDSAAILLFAPGEKTDSVDAALAAFASSNLSHLTALLTQVADKR